MFISRSTEPIVSVMTLKDLRSRGFVRDKIGNKWKRKRSTVTKTDGRKVDKLLVQRSSSSSPPISSLSLSSMNMNKFEDGLVQIMIPEYKGGIEKENDVTSLVKQKVDGHDDVEFDSERGTEQPSSAGASERKGIHGLNHAFNQLKSLVPRLPSDKLSKIQTVRLATFYIDFLFKLLNDVDSK